MKLKNNKLPCFSPQDSQNSAIYVVSFTTELGSMIACATQKGLCMLEFEDSKRLDMDFRQLYKNFKIPFLQQENQHLKKLKIELSEYFDGKRKEFGIPLDVMGTEFQKKAWSALLKIPYGKTTNYAKQAEIIGKPTAARAVANANAHNKISVVVPCHRVIGVNGALAGYAGGTWRKMRLLELEAKYV
jgi:AraC family transcriptional regulator of adaptative response/methylated-DNA-[protein]-cysteine methyltransferase